MAEELVMRMVAKSGGPVQGESMVSIEKTDILMKGFVAGQMLDVKSFDFDVSIDDMESADDYDSDKAKKEKDSKKKKRSVKFKAWLDGSNMSYPAELKPFSFERQIDKASPTLFTMAANSQAFSTISLVVRKIVGGAAGTTMTTQAYLRFDFTDALLTSLKWDMQDNLVMEKGEFICRSVQVQYCPQNPDGSLGAAVSGNYTYVSMTQ